MTLKTIFLTIALAATMAGCATAFNPAGDSHYDCNRKENPNSPYCHSFRAVEGATNGSVPSSRFDQQMDLRTIDQLEGIAPVGGKPATGETGNTAAAALAEPPLPHQAPGDALPDGTPVRVAPVVQRTWIASHRDSNDVLHGEEYLYREIVPSRWAGQPALQNARQHSDASSFPHRARAATTISTPELTPPQPAPAKPSAQPSTFSQPGAQKPQDPPATDPNDASSALPQ